MRKIAEKRMAEYESTYMSASEVKESVKKFHIKYTTLLLLGVISVLLYMGLYMYNAELVALAKSTMTGHKGLFFVPILVALIFSFVHGAFTAKFWDVLGVKAKKS